MTEDKVSKAKISHAKQIQQLVNSYAKQDLMLFRSLNDIYEDIRDFWVYKNDKEIAGCAALHIDWEDLAEIRSLAVDEQQQKTGVGQVLVKYCLDEARELEVKKVFVLTYVPDFFRKLGFSPYEKEKLPHKIWNDCLKCHKFPDCDEEAMILKL